MRSRDGAVGLTFVMAFALNAGSAGGQALPALPSVPSGGSAPGTEDVAPWRASAQAGTRSEASAPEPEVRRSRRVLAEVLGVLAGGAVGIGVGAGVGCAVNPPNCVQGLPYGAIAVSVFSLPVGVFVAGGLLRGNGGFGWTMLGEMAGLAVALPIAALVNNGLAQGVIVGTLPVLGMIAAYEVTSDDVAPRVRPDEHAVVVPTLATVEGGATIGVGGRF